MATDAHRRPRLLGISGSLRRDSNNTTILRTLQERIRDKAELTLFPLNEIPPYNADLEGDNFPESVQALKRAIAESDGLVFCSPEYNYGMSGVLKNALDWASRPAFKSPLKGKPALIMTSSPAATGGARAQAQLREALAATLARIVARPQIVIAGANEKIQEGRFVDQTGIEVALGGIDDLLREVTRAPA